MSAKPENNFISSVHRHLPAKLYRMKNHNVYNAGIADCWYSGVGGDLWIEYKFLVLPKRDSTVIDLVGGKDPALSHLQQAWLTDRHNEGRQVGVVVGCKEGGAWFPGTTWKATYTTEVLRAALVSRQEVAKTILNYMEGRT